MKAYTTTTTFSQLGDHIIQPKDKDGVPFVPSLIEVDVAPRVNTPIYTGIQRCFGWTDLTRKMCDTDYVNISTGNAKSEKTTSRLVRLWGEDASGNIIIVLEAEYVETIIEGTNVKVKFNVIKQNTAFQASIKCLG